MASSPMHKTRNDLAPKVRGRIVALLNARLADGIDLYLQTKQAHWNASDLFTAISRGMDKGLWLLEAHRQAQR